jgi:hypothetical protein
LIAPGLNKNALLRICPDCYLRHIEQRRQRFRRGLQPFFPHRGLADYRLEAQLQGMSMSHHAPRTKTSIIQGFIGTGDWRNAIRRAARLPRLDSLGSTVALDAFLSTPK